MRLDHSDKKQRIKELFEQGLGAQTIVERLGIAYQTVINHKPGYMKKKYRKREKAKRNCLTIGGGIE